MMKNTWERVTENPAVKSVSASTIDLDSPASTPFNRQFAAPFPLPVRAGNNVRSSASRYPRSRAAAP